MKKIFLYVLLFGTWIANAQITKEEQTNLIVHIVDSINKVNAAKINTNITDTTSEIKSIGFNLDSLQQAINNHQLKFGDIDGKLTQLQAEVSKMSKLKISGYMQVQYDMYNYQDNIKPYSSTTNVPLTTNPVEVTNSFFIRRARVKFTYKPTEGVVFVLQPNFSFSAVTLKDAYVQLNDPWLNTFELWVGQFNRPDYEVEFSSRSRILLERSRMSGILYPSERDLGAKLVADFSTHYKIPLNIELAAFNGNFGQGTASNQNSDVDSGKDVMLRAVYSLAFPSSGLGIDFGASGYYGKNTVFVAGTFSDENNVNFEAAIGDKLDKQWIGTEAQIYYDVLGGLALKAEYNFGTISGEAYTPLVLNNNPGFNFSGVRDFIGFYTVLEKNVGSKNQLAIRYDSWDPNRKLSGNDVTVSPDLEVHTWSFAWNYFFTENIKIALGYSMPINETSTTVGGIYLSDVKDNILTLRFQASF